MSDLNLLDQIQQKAQAEGVLRPAQVANATHQARRDPVGLRAGQVDALVDAADFALGHLIDQLRIDQALDVVVDALRRLPEPLGNFSARARLGQLPHHLDGLRLEQGFDLSELFEDEHIAH